MRRAGCQHQLSFLLRFGKYPTQSCESCGDGSAKCFVRCKVHLVLYQKPETFPNRCVIVDAVLPQTSRKKLTKNTVLNLLLWCGAIWRRTEKLQCRCTTTVPQVHYSPRNILVNLLPVWLLVRTILFDLTHFWTTCTKFDTCYQYYRATCQKEFI